MTCLLGEIDEWGYCHCRSEIPCKKCMWWQNEEEDEEEDGEADDET